MASRIEALRARLAAATKGPWRWNRLYLLQDVPCRDGGEGREENPFSTPVGRPIADDGSAGDEYSPTIDTRGPDAALIAAAPTDLADLLATLEKVRELRDRLVAFSNKNSRITCNEYEQDRAQQADNDAEELTEILAPWEGDKR